jgi:hypothetical protein
VERLDWSAPWLAACRVPGEVVAERVTGGMPVHESLNQAPGNPVRFVAQDALAPGVAYEEHIFSRRECPTRDNLHDFFNGLCWLTFPQAKARLNALQAGQIRLRGSAAPRGPVRDAITVFDENGALLCAPDPLWQALLARDWRRLFVDLRPLWAQAWLVIFGHALLEKLVAPRKDMTAHVWCMPAPEGGPAVLDGWLAGQLTEARLAAKPFTPLPVLGVPGWWAANQNFSFYDDSLVFRPKRVRTGNGHT